MRLLFISNVFPGPIHPLKGQFNHELVRTLALAHDVTVICPISWVDRLSAWCRSVTEPQSSIANFKVYYPTFFYPPRFGRNHYHWFYWQSIRRTVRHILHQGKPDAILGYWAHPDGAAAVRAARLAGVPATVMVGGTDVLLLTRDSGRRQQVVRALQQADAVIAVSDDIRDRLAQMGVSTKRTHVIPRGVDTTAFCPMDRNRARQKTGIPHNATALLWVGRLVPVKGLDVLLEALPGLAARNPAIRLYLIGDGPLHGTLRRTAMRLGVADRVFFVGSVPHHGLRDWYCAADLFVLPSRSEGIPNVLRECTACGTPFVASQVGGIASAFDQWTHNLVPPDSSQLLAEKIEQVLQSGCRPSKSAEDAWTWDESAEAVVNVLRGNRHSASHAGPEVVVAP